MESIVITLENERQLSLIKALLEEMHIKFVSQLSTDAPLLSAKLEQKIQNARQEKAKGELRTIDAHKLWESI